MDRDSAGVRPSNRTLAGRNCPARAPENLLSGPGPARVDESLFLAESRAFLPSRVSTTRGATRPTPRPVCIRGAPPAHRLRDSAATSRSAGRPRPLANARPGPGGEAGRRQGWLGRRSTPRAPAPRAPEQNLRRTLPASVRPGPDPGRTGFAVPRRPPAPPPTSLLAFDAAGDAAAALSELAEAASSPQ